MKEYDIENYSHRKQGLQFCWSTVLGLAVILGYISTLEDLGAMNSPFFVGSVALVVVALVCTSLMSIMVFKSNRPGAERKRSWFINNEWFERVFIQVALVNFMFALLSFMIYFFDYVFDGLS